MILPFTSTPGNPGVRGSALPRGADDPFSPFFEIPFDGPPGPDYHPPTPTIGATAPGPQPCNAGVTPGYRRPKPTDGDHVTRLDLEIELARRDQQYAEFLAGRSAEVRHLEGRFAGFEAETRGDLFALAEAVADLSATKGGGA